MPAAEVGALVHKRGDGGRPALVDLAQNLSGGHAHVREEDFVKARVARHLPQGSHRDALGVHVREQAGYPAMLRRLGVGAHQQQAPVGHLREARPDLLAVDTEVVAVARRLRPERGEVAARVRLGEALTPDLLAREDRRQVARLLLVGAQRDDGRADEREADGADELRGVGARQLLLKDGLLHQRRAAPAESLRPGDAGPAAVIELALPRAQILDVLRAVFGARAAARPLRGDVLRQPRAELVAELLLARS